MNFLEALPVTFKEIAPNYNIPEKWKEIVLNTGGTHSTLQDIKLPQKAGGYWYKNAKTANTRNRFLYWQTTPDAIELSEASMDVNLASSNLRCKVAAGTPPLNGITYWERISAKQVVVLAATVSSVHRLVFPHPEVLDKKVTFGLVTASSTSIFHDTSSINNPSNYCILNQHTNANNGVAHTCASLLRDNGEAVFALAYGQGGDGGVLIVKLPLAGAAVTQLLKRESNVPRFLSGITGALRGKSANESVETYGAVVCDEWVVALCGDASLRAWRPPEPAPAALSAPLSTNALRPKPPPHGHMLQKAVGNDGVILVAFLSFPNECEFVVIKMQDNGSGSVKFSHVCRLYGPQLDLLDYTIGYGDGNYVIWALWCQADGETLITTSEVGAESRWRAVAARGGRGPLPALGSHQLYRDHLLAPALFPAAVLRKALAIYKRAWGGTGGAGGAGGETAERDLGEAAVSAVSARLRHLQARPGAADTAHLMHKCWSDLYSWCLQYMEGLQKPLGLMVSLQDAHRDGGWWCAVVRKAGISLIRELEPLEKMMLSNFDDSDSSIENAEAQTAMSWGARALVRAGARFAALAQRADAALERQLFACAAPQHRLLPRLLRLLLCPPLDAPPILTPQQIDELTSMLEPIKDLQDAVLELNDLLRLDVPEIDTSKDEFEDTEEYDNLFSSDLGVAIVTESIQQMAEMRTRVVRGCVGAAGVARGADGVPGAGHCVVHWQAYRALRALAACPLQPSALSSTSEELFRLKLSSLGAEPASCGAGAGAGVVAAYAAGAGGRRARSHLAAARASSLSHLALPLYTHHLAHQLWAVSGNFDFGWWLACINQPRLVQNYVTLLEPWCEWNACSRQFILGLSLLDMDDAEGAYTAFCKAAKGVSTEPFLRQLIISAGTPTTQHQALVLYYLKVIKLFEIHDMGACVVRLAETAISIADKDDPNLTMLQWVVFKWHLSGGRVERALAAAAANPAPAARAAAAAALLSTLASRKQLGALVQCDALAGEAERAATTRARLHDAHLHNPYYDYLYALHITRNHYRKAAAIMYERATRCVGESGNGDGDGAGDARARRRFLAAALCALRLAAPEHAFLVRPATGDPLVIGVEELARELREEDPDSRDPVQIALSGSEEIDFDNLYPNLKDANAETLVSVLKRVLSTGQFIPQWFLQRYMSVDSGGCIRALLGGGRMLRAGAACAEALRGAGRGGCAPLAAADLVLAELAELAEQRAPAACQMYEELSAVIEEYMKLIVQTSENMMLNPIANTVKLN